MHFCLLLSSDVIEFPPTLNERQYAPKSFCYFLFFPSYTLCSKKIHTISHENWFACIFKLKFLEHYYYADKAADYLLEHAKYKSMKEFSSAEKKNVQVPSLPIS